MSASRGKCQVKNLSQRNFSPFKGKLSSILIIATGLLLTGCVTSPSTNAYEFSDPIARAAAEAIYKDDVLTLKAIIESAPIFLESKSAGNYDLLDLSLQYDKPSSFSLLLKYGAIKTRSVDQQIRMIRRLAVQERYSFLEALVDNDVDLLSASDKNLDLIHYLLVNDNTRYYFGRVLKIVAMQHHILSGEYVLSASYLGKWTMMADLLAYDIDFRKPRETLELVKKDVSLVRSRGGIYPEVDRQLEIVVALLRQKYGYDGK